MRVLAIAGCLHAAALCAAPAVGGFSPSSGKPGVQVIIDGSGFSSAIQVQFNNTPADFTSVSDIRMVATVPVDATSGPVHVMSPTGTGTSSGTFLVAPRIGSFLPPRSATNTAIFIVGSNFTGATNVLFNSRPASAFTVTSSAQIQATVPTGATNGPITVQTSAGSATSTNSFLVTGPAPIVDDFSPSVSVLGASIFIYGANFANVTGVKFGTVDAATFAATALTQIQAQTPAAAVSGKISVTTVAGTATSTNVFTSTLAPVITNFFPGFGVSNTLVQIEGINFTGTIGVGFGGKPAAWNVTSPNQLIAAVPASATNSGPITVTNSAGTGVSAGNFIVTRAPIIDGFNPVLAGPGAPVAIFGANLSNGPTVLKFNGSNAAFVVTGLNGSQVQATVPAGATSGPLTMTNAFGSFTTSSNFMVTGSAPYVLELLPDRAPRGTTILIMGGGFVNPVTVNFNGVPSTNTTVTAPTQIQATVPATATTGPLTVTTPNGTSTSNPVFYVPPRLSGFSPTNGIVGSSVVITGANFAGVSSVLFNTGASSFNVTASNLISAVVPIDATTGPLTVSAPGGVIISTNSFRVQLHITGFSFTLGPVGTLVTIFGASFFNVTNVSFNASAATFTVISPEEIRATVPTGATTGPIRVSTPDGTAVSATNFYVTQSSDLSLSMTESASLLKPGQSLTYSLAITNRGPSIVTGVRLVDTLPPGVILLSENSSRGTIVFTNGVVTCNFGVLTNGTGETVTILVAVPNEGVLVNSAVVTSIEPDLLPGDNSVSVVTTVVSDASRTLAINLLSNRIVAISWPVSTVPFSLQFLSDLSASNVWLPLTNAPAVLGGFNTVTNDATAGSRFFRLQRP